MCRRSLCHAFTPLIARMLEPPQRMRAELQPRTLQRDAVQQDLARQEHGRHVSLAQRRARVAARRRQQPRRVADQHSRQAAAAAAVAGAGQLLLLRRQARQRVLDRRQRQLELLRARSGAFKPLATSGPCPYRPEKHGRNGAIVLQNSR